MPSSWRIVRTLHATTAFSGEGARRSGGRWNSIGVPLVYTAAYRSLAALEILANARPLSPADEYVFIEASWDGSLAEELLLRRLPADWRAPVPRVETRAIGAQWVRDARSAVLAVPNVLIPAETNYLINPAHPDFPRIRIGSPEPFVFDPRLVPA